MLLFFEIVSSICAPTVLNINVLVLISKTGKIERKKLVGSDLKVKSLGEGSRSPEVILLGKKELWYQTLEHLV